jgi:hypothetical protein
LLSTSLGGTNTSSFNEEFPPLLRFGGQLLVAVGNTTPFFLFFAISPPFLRFSIDTGVGVAVFVLGVSAVTSLFSLLHEFFGPLCWPQILFGFSAV